MGLVRQEFALEWAQKVAFPLVLKLAPGAASTNVRLVHTPAEAQRWIERLFSRHLQDLDERQFAPLGIRRRLRRAARVVVKGASRPLPDKGFDPQAGYVLFQEFLPDNDPTTHASR